MRFFAIRSQQREEWAAEVTKGLHGSVDKEGKKLRIEGKGKTEEEAIKDCINQLKKLGLLISPYEIKLTKEKQMRGRKLVTLTDEQVKALDWTQPNDVLAAQLNVCATTVIRLRKANNVASLGRGRPKKVVEVVPPQV